MPRSIIAGGIAAFILLLALMNSFYIVQQGEQALVLQFGQWRRTVADPGMHAKMPFLEDVMFFEKRVLDIEPSGQQVTLGDKTRLEVDSYARYRIVDPRRFYQALQNEQAGRIRLANIVNSSLSEILARYTLSDMLSRKRLEIMASLRERVRAQAEGTGVDIIDVRISRADLPDQTSAPIFARMISERQREASQARAEGQEAAARIRSEADRDRTTIMSEAQRDASITRGAGDREALETVARATGRSPEFYSFYRSLEAYRAAFNQNDTSIVLTPDNQFMRYFEQAPKGR